MIIQFMMDQEHVENLEFSNCLGSVIKMMQGINLFKNFHRKRGTQQELYPFSQHLRFIFKERTKGALTFGAYN